MLTHEPERHLIASFGGPERLKGKRGEMISPNDLAYRVVLLGDLCALCGKMLLLLKKQSYHRGHRGRRERHLMASVRQR
jgi:hypothetical protein